MFLNAKNCLENIYEKKLENISFTIFYSLRKQRRSLMNFALLNIFSLSFVLRQK